MLKLNLNKYSHILGPLQEPCMGRSDNPPEKGQKQNFTVLIFCFWDLEALIDNYENKTKVIEVLLRTVRGRSALWRISIEF